MKNKASLVLMEQLIMVLVFAVGAALCLGLFARSGQIARQTRLREEAALTAQSAAELMKSGRDLSGLDSGIFTVEVERCAPLPGLLSEAVITVSYEGSVLCRLETGWQEGLP